MSIAFVIGNGISRQGIALEHLRTLGKVYGCNSLHKDFIPDVLVATDRPISTFIQESGYSAKHTFYTRRPLSGLGALQVPTEYHGFSSGPIAVGISAIDQHATVYLVGFDMGPAENKTFNNVYADTEFYRPSESPPTYTGNWIKQICKIAQDFPACRREQWAMLTIWI
jgi:hypothetical protein